MRVEIAELDLENSRKEFERISKVGCKDFSPEPPFQGLRNDLTELFKKNYNGRKDYDLDLSFAIDLYRYFSQFENFNETIASNFDFWRYLSLKVVPDLVSFRHGLIPEYFYKKTTRIYLSTLWWYIHMSFNGDLETTRNLLKDLSTDYILQMVERGGRGVYLSINRLIMRALSLLPESVRNQKKSGKNLFRRVMIQYTAVNKNYNLVIEGEEKEFVHDLFKACGVEVNNYGF